MSFGTLSWIAAGDFIEQHRVGWNALIYCVLLTASAYILWSRWISFRQRKSPPDDGAGNTMEPGASADKDRTSRDGENTSQNRVSNTSDENTPPAAEYPLQVLHEDPEAIVEYALPWIARKRNSNRYYRSIVAVHGLGANPAYAWVWLPRYNSHDSSGYPDKPFNWLAKLLPRRLPCRVIAFNYDSKWHKDAPQQRLSNISDSLLDSLRNNREKVGLPFVLPFSTLITINRNGRLSGL